MPQMSPEELARRKTEVIDEIKRHLSQVNDCEDSCCNNLAQNIGDFCRFYNYNQTSDADCKELVVSDLVADFKESVFVLDDVDTAFIDARIPLEWK